MAYEISLLREDNLKKLIKYTIEEPEIDVNFDQKKSFKLMRYSLLYLTKNH